MRALIGRRHFKGAPRTGRGLLKNQGDILSLQTRHFVAASLRPLQVFREVDEIRDFSRSVVTEAEQAAIPKIERHFLILIRKASQEGLRGFQ